MHGEHSNQGHVLGLPSGAPKLPEDVFVAPGAVVVGDVTLGEGCSVWYGAVLRADGERVEIGDNCNIQDGAVLHADPGEPAILEAGVTVGHRAIVHGAVVEENSLIGMGAIVLNGARIGSGSLVAASALVRGGTVIPPNSLVAGVPATVKRDVSDEEREMILATAEEYREKAKLHAAANPISR